VTRHQEHRRDTNREVRGGEGATHRSCSTSSSCQGCSRRSSCPAPRRPAGPRPHLPCTTSGCRWRSSRRSTCRGTPSGLRSPRRSSRTAAEKRGAGRGGRAWSERRSDASVRSRSAAPRGIRARA
jgi:hypothetical protein